MNKSSDVNPMTQKQQEVVREHLYRVIHERDLRIAELHNEITALKEIISGKQEQVLQDLADMGQDFERHGLDEYGYYGENNPPLKGKE